MRYNKPKKNVTRPYTRGQFSAERTNVDYRSPEGWREQFPNPKPSMREKTQMRYVDLYLDKAKVQLKKYKHAQFRTLNDDDEFDEYDKTTRKYKKFGGVNQDELSDDEHIDTMDDGMEGPLGLIHIDKRPHKWQTDNKNKNSPLDLLDEVKDINSDLDLGDDEPPRIIKSRERRRKPLYDDEFEGEELDHDRDPVPKDWKFQENKFRRQKDKRIKLGLEEPDEVQGYDRDYKSYKQRSS